MHAVTMTQSPKGPDLALPTDVSADDLLGRVASRRDRAALVALFDLFGPRIKAMLIKQGANESLADDLVQDTLVNVWRKAHLFASSRGSASAWIFTIASTKPSRASIASVSVGSISRHSGTSNGK